SRSPSCSTQSVTYAVSSVSPVIRSSADTSSICRADAPSRAHSSLATTRSSGVATQSRVPSNSTDRRRENSVRLNGREQRRDAASIELDHQVDVERGTTSAVPGGGERAGEHVGNACLVQRIHDRPEQSRR